METKNAIIRNYADALVAAANNVTASTSILNDNIEENKAVIATLNVLVEAIRSHTALLQNALDEYK